MHTTAFTTNPSALIQTCLTFRSGNASALVAGLGSKTFVNFLKHRAMLNSLVREYFSEGRPAGIHNGFRHAGFSKFCRIDIANGDVIELSNNAGGEFVVEVMPRIRDTGMNIHGLTLLSCPLRLCQLFLKFAEVARVFNLFASGKRSKVFQAQVNADAGLSAAHRRVRNVNHDVQEPIAAPVPGEVCAISNLSIGEWATVEDSKGVAIEPKSIAFTVQIPSAQRNPSKRPFPAIAEVRSATLNARFRVLQAYFAYGAGVQPKFFTASTRQIGQGKSAWPLLIPLEGVLLAIVTKIPDVVNRSGLLVQQSVQVLHTVSIDQRRHVSNFTTRSSK